MKPRWFEYNRESEQPNDGGEPFTPSQQVRFTLGGLFVIVWPVIAAGLVLLLLIEFLG